MWAGLWHEGLSLTLIVTRKFPVWTFISLLAPFLDTRQSQRPESCPWLAAFAEGRKGPRCEMAPGSHAGLASLHGAGTRPALLLWRGHGSVRAAKHHGFSQSPHCQRVPAPWLTSCLSLLHGCLQPGSFSTSLEQPFSWDTEEKREQNLFVFIIFITVITNVLSAPPFQDNTLRWRRRGAGHTLQGPLCAREGRRSSPRLRHGEGVTPGPAPAHCNQQRERGLVVRCCAGPAMSFLIDSSIMVTSQVARCCAARARPRREWGRGRRGGISRSGLPSRPLAAPPEAAVGAEGRVGGAWARACAARAVCVGPCAFWRGCRVLAEGMVLCLDSFACCLERNK